MLDFKVNEQGNLEVTADKEARLELSECENCVEREALIAENHYESYYDYKNANQIKNNLSEAPIFATELDYSESDGTIRFYDDYPIYYYNDYMINDFTEKLMNGETVVFNQL